MVSCALLYSYIIVYIIVNFRSVRNEHDRQSFEMEMAPLQKKSSTERDCIGCCYSASL